MDRSFTLTIGVVFFIILNTIFSMNLYCNAARTLKTQEAMELEFFNRYKDDEKAGSVLRGLSQTTLNKLCVRVGLEGGKIADTMDDASLDVLAGRHSLILEDATFDDLYVFFEFHGISRTILTTFVICDYKEGLFLFIRESADPEIGNCYYVMKQKWIGRFHFSYEVCVPQETPTA